jgi:glycosyltransferase involved in cell wall biosynthesis
MPLISIIVPIYNTEQYLEKCLDSLVNQYLDDVEIICVNDGSSDGSPSILKKYSEKYPQIIVLNQENSGQAVARNVGLEIARGQYISFVDSDDWIEPNLYTSALQFFQNDIDVVIFGVNVICSTNINNAKSMKKYFSTQFSEKIKIDRRVIMDSPATSWNKIYRKNIIDKYQISFPRGLLYEDNSFHWKYLMHSKKAYFLNQKLYNYMIHKNSIMQCAKPSQIVEYIFVCQEIFEHIKKHNLQKKYQDAFVDFFEKCVAMLCVYSDNPKESLKKAREIWQNFGIKTDSLQMHAFQNENYDYVIKWRNYSFWEKIFSIKNRYGKKVITICGLQFYYF